MSPTVAHCEECGLPLRVPVRFCSQQCRRDYLKRTAFANNGQVNNYVKPSDGPGVRQCDMDYNGTYDDGWLDDAIKIIEKG